MTADYPGFLQSTLESERLDSVAKIFHRIRNIPYGSTGQRDPTQVLLGNQGSCSGKHILLRDLLRASGRNAEVMTMFTFFSDSTPTVSDFPEPLKDLCTEGRVPDFHHYVRIEQDNGWVELDATWHDALIPYGFPVNADWSGQGNTRLASLPEQLFPNQEDVIGFKKQKIATLTPVDQERRLRFFTLLTEWIATL